MARTLEVHLGDKLAGIVTQRTGGNFCFEYELTYAAKPTSIPLSFSMPLTQRAAYRHAYSPALWTDASCA